MQFEMFLIYQRLFSFCLCFFRFGQNTKVVLNLLLRRAIKRLVVLPKNTFRIPQLSGTFQIIPPISRQNHRSAGMPRNIGYPAAFAADSKPSRFPSFIHSISKAEVIVFNWVGTKPLSQSIVDFHISGSFSFGDRFPNSDSFPLMIDRIIFQSGSFRGS